MRFGFDNGPFHGEKRIVEAFAWFPVCIVQGTARDEYVWLESYWKQQEYKRYQTNSGWTTICKLFKEEYEPRQ